MNNQPTTPIATLTPAMLIALILANFYFIQNFWLGLVIGIIFLVRQGIKAGKLVLPQFNAYFQAALGGLTFIAINSIILWIGFYLYRVNNLLIFVSLFFTTALLELLCVRFQREQARLHYVATVIRRVITPEGRTASLRALRSNLTNLTLCVVYFVLAGVCFFYLAKHGTADAIASPWLIISKNFWFIFIAATFALVALCLAGSNKKLSVFCVSVHTFLIAGLGFFIYKLGFGYDPFIHFAAMREIIDHGTLLPKTPYYIGGYTMIIFLTKTLGLSLDFVNRALLPFLFALTAPITIYTALRKYFVFNLRATRGEPRQGRGVIASIAKHPYQNVIASEARQSPTLSLFALLLLPLTFFISTTPQGLTNLICLVVIFLSLLLQNKQISPFFLLFIAFFAFTIHPLYGAPLIIFVLTSIAFTRIKKRKLKIIAVSVGAILTGAIIPLMFAANSLLNGQTVSLAWSAKLSFFYNAMEQSGRQFNFLFDLLYAYGFNARFIFAGLALIGLILLIRRKQFAPYSIFIYSGTAMLVGYFFSANFLNFEFVTEKNKCDYLLRLSELACYFAMPIVVYLFYEAANYARQNLIAKAFIVITLTMLTGACLYFTYPVKDHYTNTHSFNISQADINTVHFIQDNAHNDYIVLGNQMLAAAAIREFGFAHYYNNNFYYSIPEAGANKIYPYFQKMALGKPLRVHAEDAMKTAGVNQAYFVLPEYWSGGKRLIEEAKKTADKWFAVDGGKTHVFIFTK